MIRRPPRSTRTDTLFPYTTLFRSQELGLRPSIFMDFGALFDVKKPLPTAVFPTHEDADGNVIVDPIINPVFDGEGNPLFIVPTDAADNAGKITTRSEERRVGKECVSKCSARWSPVH